jgi:hypothetical protein
MKLYRQARVSDISLNLPEVEHLAFSQLGKPLEYQSVYNGQSYQVLEVRYALVASKEGNYTIGPSRMNLTVFQPKRRSPRGLFDDPFFQDPFFSFSTGKPITLASEAMELNVLPLPQEGRPADFSGLVGSFKLESELQPSTVKAGESATFTVLVSGRGNVKRIPDLNMPELEQTKVYADQPVLEVKTDAKGVRGSKTMKWALVPEREGLCQIPPLKISFFDTKSQQYQVIRTTPHSLSVLPGEKDKAQILEAVGGKKGPGKQAVKELGRDILPIHTSIKDFAAVCPTLPSGIPFWLVLFTPPFAYVVSLSGRRLRRRSPGTLAATRARKAAKTLIKQCRQGRVSSADLIQFTRDYLNNRFLLSFGSLTADEAAEILKTKGVKHETAQELRGILLRLENTVYTGRGNSSCDMGEEIAEVVKRIEKEIR